MDKEYTSTREMYKNYREHRRTYRAERERKKRTAAGENFLMKCVTVAAIGLFIYIISTSESEIGKMISERINEKVSEFTENNFTVEKIADIGERIIKSGKDDDIVIDEDAAEKINKKEKIYSENCEIKN